MLIVWRFCVCRMLTNQSEEVLGPILLNSTPACFNSSAFHENMSEEQVLLLVIFQCTYQFEVAFNLGVDQ